MTLGAGPAEWTAAYVASQQGSCGIPGAWPSLGRTTRLLRPALSLQSLVFKDRAVMSHRDTTKHEKGPALVSPLAKT
jgi:hypothetical protein